MVCQVLSENLKNLTTTAGLEQFLSQTEKSCILSYKTSFQRISNINYIITTSFVSHVLQGSQIWFKSYFNFHGKLSKIRCDKITILVHLPSWQYQSSVDHQHDQRQRVFHPTRESSRWSQRTGSRWCPEIDKILGYNLEMQLSL